MFIPPSTSAFFDIMGGLVAKLLLLPIIICASLYGLMAVCALLLTLTAVVLLLPFIWCYHGGSLTDVYSMVAGIWNGWIPHIGIAVSALVHALTLLVT